MRRSEATGTQTITCYMAKPMRCAFPIVFVTNVAVCHNNLLAVNKFLTATKAGKASEISIHRKVG